MLIAAICENHAAKIDYTNNNSNAKHCHTLQVASKEVKNVQTKQFCQPHTVHIHQEMQKKSIEHEAHDTHTHDLNYTMKQKKKIKQNREIRPNFRIANQKYVPK